MSGLLYTTSAGAVDFYVTALVLVFGFLFGRPKIKLLCGLVAAGFVMQRAAILFLSNYPSHHAIFLSIVFLSLMILATSLSDGKVVKSFATLYALCIAASLLWLNGLIGFWDAANGLTVALYLQLLLIIGGGVHDGFLSMGDKRSGSGGVHSNNRRFGLSVVLEKHKAK